jgi:TPR repeat protein
MGECRHLPIYDPQFIFQLTEICERAVAGDPQALFVLGNLYDAGRRVPRNETFAVRMFRLAAQGGSRAARLRLTSMGYGDYAGMQGPAISDGRKRF